MRQRPLRNRLWFGGTMVVTFLLILVIGNHFIDADKSVARNMLGHDFTAFYSAGHFADTRQFDKLYDIEAVKAFEQQTGKQANLTLGDAYGPFWNPPFYAWVFAPFARMPYGDALLAWTLINIICLIISIGLLCRILLTEPAQFHDPIEDDCAPAIALETKESVIALNWRNWGLVPLLILGSMPVIQALSHGQNTMTSLLLLTSTVFFWRRRQSVLAGIICGFLFYKPQLGAIVATALIASQGAPAFLGLMFTGVGLLAVTEYTMPDAVADFLVKLPANLEFMQVDHPYVWERHATIKAFWRLLLMGRDAGRITPIVAGLVGFFQIALAGYFVVSIRKFISHRKTILPDSIIAATIVTMPLLMPFYFDYDLLLISVAAVLYAREYNQHPYKPLDKWIIRNWAVLYLWMLINPGISAQTHFNLNVPLLFSLAMMLIKRAGMMANEHADLHQKTTVPLGHRFARASWA